MAIYHLHAQTGTRGGGQSAAAKFDYLSRLGAYARQPDKVVHLISSNMPIWASNEPRLYWQAADQNERANGRLFKELEGALPFELDHAQRVDLAEKFASQVTAVSGGLPFTLALHEGRPKRPGVLGNPHFHLEISERINDGHARDASTWFKRAAVGKGKEAADGGAPKTADLKPKEWLINTRKLWAELCNEALAQAGYQALVDHRSLTAQGVDRNAQVHLGPTAFAFENRTGEHSRRRIELDQAKIEEQAWASKKLHELEALSISADADRRDSIRLRKLAFELESLEIKKSELWIETSDGFDLFDLLSQSADQPAGPYRVKMLPSGVVLHLRMPADRVAFVERTDRLRMSSTDALDPESVRHALDVGFAKWGALTLTGSDEFRRLAVAQAVSLGLVGQLAGLSPDDEHYAAILQSKFRQSRSSP